MTILSVLQHRATVERASEQMFDGVPVRTWSVVAVRAPVLLSRDEVLTDPTWTATQRHESDTRATLFALPAAALLPGDRVHLTRPAQGGSHEVLPDPSTVLTLHHAHHAHHAHHKEFKVRSVSS